MDITLKPKKKLALDKAVTGWLARNGYPTPATHHLRVDIRFVKKKPSELEAVQPKPVPTPIPKNEETDRKLALQVSDLDLSHGSKTRIHHCLRNGELYTIGEIVRKNDFDLLELRNFSRGSLLELKKALEKLGLTTFMTGPLGPIEKAVRFQTRLYATTPLVGGWCIFRAIPGDVAKHLADSGFSSLDQILNPERKAAIVKLLNGFCLSDRKHWQPHVDWMAANKTGEERYGAIFKIVQSYCTGQPSPA